MNFIKVIVTVFLFNFLAGFSQADTLNKLNAKGKKNGYWISYLDANTWKTDSASAKFLMFEFYDNGKLITNTPKYNWKAKNNLKCELDSFKNSKLISGTFKWYDPKTKQLIVEEKYLNGHPVTTIEYFYYKSQEKYICSMKHLYFYNKRYNNEHGSFYYEEWNDTSYYYFTSELKRSWFKKSGKKWRFETIKGA